MKFTEEAKVMAFPKAAFFIKIKACAAMVVLLIFLFSSLSSAIDGNLSISGTKTLDLNANGLKDPSDPALEGYMIYIDKNNDSQWQPNEVFTKTDRNGEYSFNNISNGTYIIRELTSSGQLPLSYPKSGYHLVDFTRPFATSVTGLNFGSSIQTIVENDSKTDSIFQLEHILGIIAIIVIGILGVVLLILGFKGFKTDADKKAIIQIALGFALLLLVSYLLLSLIQQSRNTINAISIGSGNPFLIIISVFLGLLVFGAVLYMCHLHANQHEVGSMRKMIAGVLVIGLIAVIFFALDGAMQNHDIIIQYIQLVGIIIAFYFGSRVASEAAEKTEVGNAEKDLDIKNVTYDANTGKILIKMSNSKGRDFGVDTVAIKDGENTLIDQPAAGFGSSAKKEVEVYAVVENVESKNKLAKSMKDNPDKEYDITIKTRIGDKSFKWKIEKPA